MDVNKIFERVKQIIVDPKTEWIKIKTEITPPKDILLQYVVPFLVLAAITRLLGYLVFSEFQYISVALKYSIISLISPLIGIIISSYVIYYLAEQFQSKKDLANSFQLVAYASTPSLLAAVITNLAPLYLSWVGLFGLYSLYLFWIGLPVMLETPEEKKVPYVIVSVLVIIVINIVLGLLFSKLAFSF